MKKIVLAVLMIFSTGSVAMADCQYTPCSNDMSSSMCAGIQKSYQDCLRAERSLKKLRGGQKSSPSGPGSSQDQ